MTSHVLKYTQRNNFDGNAADGGVDDDDSGSLQTM